MEPFINAGADPSNPNTHNIIVVRGVSYSVFKGTEQDTANQIAATLDS